jgi:predicted alpha/beta-hydrolase family hydrolase
VNRSFPTRYGPALRHGSGRVLLLHGAGSGTGVPVLLQLHRALRVSGVRAARLDQPYIVAGRRTPPPASALDHVLDVVLDSSRGPFVLVGRSSGARVACRAAARRRDVRAVVAFGFPLFAPSGASRAAELQAAGVPVLVVQGERDHFGSPEQVRAAARVQVHAVAAADHGLAARVSDGRSSQGCVAEAVAVATAWILALPSAAAASGGAAL